MGGEGEGEGLNEENIFHVAQEGRGGTKLFKEYHFML